MIAVWKKFRSMSLKLFIYKAIRKIIKLVKELIEEYQMILIGSNISNNQFQKLLKITEKGQKVWIQEFRYELTKKTIFSEEIIWSIPGKLNIPKEQILKQAELFKDHIFDLLGSGPVIPSYTMMAKGFGGYCFNMMPGVKAAESQMAKINQIFDISGMDYQPIDWLIDFRSGHRWNTETWYTKIIKGQPGTDIKIPWELSRFQHSIRLGQAFRLTGKEEYAAEIVCQIIDWIIANPKGYGPNWKCVMDIAIRGANWITSLALISDSKSLTDTVLWEIAKSLFQHGKFIRTHLEWSPWLTSNHYISDIAGLFFISNCCPKLPEADQWRSFTRSQLEIEIEKQVYNDGCDFEASTYYHRLVTELFFYPALLSQRIGTPFSDKYLERLESMFASIRTLLHNNGEMPQIGDNDSGRFFIIECSDALSTKMDYLLPLSEWFFEKPHQCFPRGADRSLLMWIDHNCGPEGITKVWHSRGSYLFKDAGWAVLRNDRYHVVISCGPNGQNGNGGHAHNDKLSIELSVDGLPFIVDPGSYVYTSDIKARNQFRSVASHSTPQCGKFEQNTFINGLLGAFTLKDNCRASIEKFDPLFFRGMHHGYGVELGMEMQLGKRTLRCCYAAGQGKWTMRWILHPDVTAEKISEGVMFQREKTRLLLASDLNDFIIETTEYSSSYGSVQECPMILKPFSQKLEWTLLCMD